MDLHCCVEPPQLPVGEADRGPERANWIPVARAAAAEKVCHRGPPGDGPECARQPRFWPREFHLDAGSPETGFEGGLSPTANAFAAACHTPFEEL